MLMGIGSQPIRILELRLLDHRHRRRVPLDDCSIAIVVSEVHNLE